MIRRNAFTILLAGFVLSLTMSLNAHAFTNTEIHEALIAAQNDDDGNIYDIQKVAGKNNAWQMKFKAKTAESELKESVAYGIPTIIRYAGSKLHITQELGEVDSRVVDAVFAESDVAGAIKKLGSYESMMSELTGLSSRVTHDGKRMNFSGSVSIAGKKLESVASLLVDLREETAALFYEIDQANVEALENYFEEVLDKDYNAILDTQVFVEVVGHGFTGKNQVKRKQSEMGHWEWHVGAVKTETINHGSSFDEVILLETGTDISRYQQEKMQEELLKRVKTRLPKGADDAAVIQHLVKQGVTAIVLQYPLKKSPSGEEIRDYHERFIAYVEQTYPALEKIAGKYTESVVKQQVKFLSAREFMALMDDGLEQLQSYEEAGADGQWKFKYKNVAYIITNYKRYMVLSFISSVPKGRNVEDILEKVEADIERNFRSFPDEFEVGLYKGSKRTIWVKMRFNYGVLSSSDITGRKLKERYHQFINDVAPELVSRL